MTSTSYAYPVVARETTPFLPALTFLAVLISAYFFGSPAAPSCEKAVAAAPDAYAFTAAYDKKDFAGIVTLVNAGLDVNMRTPGGKTLLTYAASDAEDEPFATSVARLLLFNGAQVNSEDSFGRVPLVYAIEGGEKALATLLLDNGADVTLRSSAYNMPVVFVPFMRKNPAMTYMVIAKCKDTDIRDSLANTPLSWASRFGYIDSVRFLLEKGAPVDPLSVHNKSPLMEASEKGHYEIAALLVQKGARINIRTKKGWSALMWASEKGYNDIVSLLIGAGADLSATNDKGERALTIARKNNHQDTAILLEKAEFRYRLKKSLIFGGIVSAFIIVAIIVTRHFHGKGKISRGTYPAS
jgi:ankyrin repeat protein